MKNLLFSTVALLTFFQAIGQTFDLQMQLRKHVQVLSADSLEGRATGSEGERKAAGYIIRYFESIGVSPAGSKGYEQLFEFKNGIRYSGNNSLLIDGQLLKPDIDFFPLANSGSGIITKGRAQNVGYGVYAPEVKVDDYTNTRPGVFVIKIGGNEADNPHSTLYKYTDINYKINTAIERGATAILFINADTSKQDDITKDFSRNIASQPIPIVFVKSGAHARKLLDNNKQPTVSLQVSLEPVKRIGRNVIGFIDNPNTKNIVVIGAHYDHLGFGHDGNALPGKSQTTDTIYNGADDNASGTAAMLELARMIKQSGLKNNDYLFIAFSGEELGLLGSKYFISNATMDTALINYMLNMDMLGRYNPEKGMEISGLGTSPKAFQFIRSINGGLKIKYSDHGTAPTDHTSFYYANIPVLSFFTGTHGDYHKPTDHEDKINYDDYTTVTRLIYTIVDSLDDKGVLPFSKTKEQNLTDVPSFKVRLGIIPDYMFEGPGVRIDGVSDGLPADKAGLRKNDIIQSLDMYDVVDVMSYMRALAAYKKGDSATLIYKRDGAVYSTTVIF